MGRPLVGCDNALTLRAAATTNGRALPPSQVPGSPGMGLCR